MRMTKEEKAARNEKLHRMAAMISELGEDGQEAIIAKFGAVLTAFGRPLSFFNTAFVLAQLGRPVAQVGGFKQWQRAGRQVRKGETAGAFIYVPISGKRKAEKAEKAEKGADKEPSETADQNGEGAKRGPVRFRLVPVFAIDQTDAIAPVEASEVAQAVA